MSIRISMPYLAVLTACLISAPAALAQMDMDTGSMQDSAPPADARDPHAYANGAEFTRGSERPRLADQQMFRSILIDNLEVSRDDGHSIVPYDIEGWYGTTWNRTVLKAEGDFESGKLAEARSELLWGHAITPYFDSQIGVRYDSGPGPNRTWLAAGIEGLAPYRFHLEATAYVGESSRTALRVDASYDMLLTQRLILEPRFEANWFGRSDRERGLGSGLSDASLSLRLRYEIRRELAPYIGVEHAREYGGTANLSRAAGRSPGDTRLVLGILYWY